jgi:4-amino-4-deoxy-L-arabinose transferase-like glycosyltransferase
MERRPPRFELLVLFAAALAIRLVHLATSTGAPSFDVPVVDEHTYHRLAIAILERGELTGEHFWQPFFYPVFLAGVYAVTGPSLLAAKLAQALLGAATALLTAVLGARTVGRRAGLVAGGIVALYGPLVFFDLELVATGWACLAAAALPLLVDEAARRGNFTACIACGAASALAVLVRPTFLPFAALAAAWLAPRLARSGLRPRAVAARLALALLAFSAIALPVAALSRIHAGRFSFLPASGPLNLYIGNNSDSAATVAIRPGWEWSELTRLPARHGVERSNDTPRFFLERVVDYARTQPLGFLQGLARKTVELASSRELPRNTDVYVHRQWSPVLVPLVWKIGPFGFPFGVLLPLAAVGAVELGRRLPWLVVLLVASHAGAVVLVFVAARLRAPLVPPLALLAAAGILALARALRARRWRRAGLLALLAAALGVATSLPGPFAQERADYEAELAYGVAARLLERGELERAEEQARHALERQPGHGESWNVLGNILVERGRLAEAVAAYRTAVEASPRNRIARDNLGRSLLALGDHAEAARQFLILLEEAPADALARYHCGLALARAGRGAEAVEQLRQARQLAGAAGDRDLAARVERALEGLE